MTINYFDDINVYFHMKNHYRKLKNVRSTVDTRMSQIYLKSGSSSHSERCLAGSDDNEKHNKNLSHLPNHSSAIKKHSCFSSDTRSDTSLCSNSRPSTRRNPRELPQQSCESRYSSLGPNFRKFTICNRQNKEKKVKKTVSDNDKGENTKCKGSVELSGTDNLQNDIYDNLPNTNRSNLSPSTERSENNGKKRNTTDEHEYLQFLLRITEDIIMNDHFTKKDINKVLENHIEANKQRLNLHKMKAHVSRLCRELNIEYEHTEETSEFLCDNILSCSPKPDVILNNCECATIRNLNFGKTVTVECNNFEENNQPNYANDAFLSLNHSLGRVTECTEPTDSLNSVIDPKFLPSDGTILSYDLELVLPGLENEQTAIIEKEDREQSEKGLPTYGMIPNNSPKVDYPKIPKLNLVTLKNSCTNIINDEFLSIDEKTNLATPENSYREDISTGNIRRLSSSLDHTIKSPGTPKKSIFTKHVECVVISTPSSPKPLKDKIESVVEEQPALPDTSEKAAANENNSLKTFSIDNSPDSSLQQPIANVSPLNLETVSPKHNNKLQFPLLSPKSPETDKSNFDSQQNSIVKLVLEGDIKNEDYVLLNGPIYVFRALIDTNPKLIVVKEEERIERETMVTPSLQKTEQTQNCSRVSTSPEVTLHSLKQKLEERFIFDDFRRSSKLISADYDLTPEREQDVNKYHYLMVDAATSVSNVNLPHESRNQIDELLLNDRYVLLVHPDQRSFDFRPKNIDNYSKMYRELPEHDYIRHNESSEQILDAPSTSTFEIFVEECQGIIDFDNSEETNVCSGSKLAKSNIVASVESSLRSDGETSNTN